MTTQNYAVVNAEGQVTNVIVSDGTFPAPSGETLVAIGSSGAQIGWTYAGGVFTNPDPASSPSSEQLAVAAGNAAISAGINVTSTSTASLNGVYAVDEQSQSDIAAVQLYILANGTFPQGQTTTYWADKSGEIHQFPSVAVFKSFATVVADFIDAVEDYQNSGGTVGVIPSRNVTIA